MRSFWSVAWRVSIAAALLGGCFNVSLSGDFGDEVTVCVNGDRGCCVVLLKTPVCTAKGCTAFQETKTRCIYCQPSAIGASGKRQAFSPPPGGPDDDAGEPAGQTLVQVCGPATYR